MKMKKIIIYIVISIFILALPIGLFKISKSRTFQLFGELIHRVDTTEKIVSLTFDDGPTAFTQEVLDILKQKNVKATFFVMGSELEKNPQIGKDIVSLGHELGNHSYSHTR